MNETVAFGDLKPGSWFTVAHLRDRWMMRLSHVVAAVSSVDQNYHSGYREGSQWNTVDDRGNFWTWSDSQWVTPIGRLSSL